MGHLHTPEVGQKSKKTEYIRARTTSALKHDAEAILEELGLDSSEAIRMFYMQIVLNKGLPFEVKLPNKQTQAAIAAVKSGKGIKRHKNMDAFKQSLE